MSFFNLYWNTETNRPVTYRGFATESAARDGASHDKQQVYLGVVETHDPTTPPVRFIPAS